MEAFSEFMDLKSSDSTVPMPTVVSQDYGGHAVCIVGYDLDKQAYLVKNSFGTNWGDQGYFWMPFAYAQRYVFESWTFDISEPQP